MYLVMVTSVHVTKMVVTPFNMP